MRGLCLSNSLEIRQVHNEFGNLEEHLLYGDEEDRKKKGSKDDDPFHFVAFVKKDDNIYELDGLLDAPIRHEAACLDENWDEKVNLSA